MPRRTTDDDPRPMVDTWLDTLRVADLRDLVWELAKLSDAGTRLLETRAALGTGADHVVEAQLLDLVRGALSASGSIPYRRSFHIAHDASAVLDELEAHLDAGHADLVLAPLLKAVTRLRTLLERADDSSGVIGSECQRAADLYTRACRQGHPDPVRLARWLARFRDTSPGWPHIELVDVAPALGRKGLEVYRRGVADLDAKHRGEPHWQRSEIHAMLLELADVDGDVDTAVDLLLEGDHPRYGEAIDRLDSASRTDEAMHLVDAAVAAGRLSASRATPGSGYWLDASDVAHRYLERGRSDDAIAALRGVFEREPGRASYRVLLGCGAATGTEAEQRQWAMEWARQIAPRAGGGLLVELLLADGDLDGAWAVEEELGAGHSWLALAEAGGQTHPGRAADLYRPQLADLLRHAHTANYARAASILRTMRTLYEADGSRDAFDAEILELRVTYRRRTALMAELDKAGLPGLPDSVPQGPSSASGTTATPSRRR